MSHQSCRFTWLLVLAACGPGGAPGTPSPGSDALAWAVPGTNPITYTIADTTAISMNMGGQTMQIDAGSVATLDLALAPATEGNVSATVTFLDLEGRFSDPMGSTTTLSAADLPGPARLTVGSTGEVTLNEVPEMTAAALQVLGSESTFKRLFQPLPGRIVPPGTQWMDTVRTVDVNEGIRATTTSVVRSTLIGDTAVDGRRLMVIRSETEMTTTVAGNAQGFEIRQNLTGTSEGLTLWDPALGAVHERREVAQLNGTMEMPAMNMTGIPVDYVNRTVMRRTPGG
ncbi:MAG: hypothetical protein ACREL7_12010 [Longimicrobiales bacterium]